MPNDRSTRPEDADSPSAYPPTGTSVDGLGGDAGAPPNADSAKNNVERAAEERTKTVVVSMVALGMLAALALPVAMGFLANHLLADHIESAMLRLTLSITAGLLTMFFCNFLIVLPLGAFAGTALQRFEVTLHDDESALLHELRAHDEARHGAASAPKSEGAGAAQSPTEGAASEPSKIDEGSDARS